MSKRCHVLCLHQFASKPRAVSIMVNIFGDRERGPKGERGAPGPSGTSGSRGPKGLKSGPRKSGGGGGIDDMCRWIPDLVLEQFQEREYCCFKIADVLKDLHWRICNLEISICIEKECCCHSS